MAVGDDFYVSVNDRITISVLSIHCTQEDLTPETTKKVLDSFAKGQKPKAGPQSGRQTSENSAGLTNLTGKVCCFLVNPDLGFSTASQFQALWTWRVLPTGV